MTKAFIIIFLFFSTLMFGQVSKDAAYKNIYGLTVTDTITCKDIIGSFYTSNGFCGSNFQLDSSMTFHKTDFSCMSSLTVDSGSWTIKGKNTVILKSSKQTLLFDVVKFDNFYFFILPTQRQKFIKDLQASKIRFKNSKPILIDNKRYSKDYLIGRSLVKKYFAKEIDEITST